MTEPLNIDAGGLRIASAELARVASQVASATATTGATSNKASSSGIASAGAAIAAFGQAYQTRIARHADATGVAAGSYTRTDDAASDAVARTI